ncbi:MAG TPA: hypothetical protein VIG99_00210 [Myxococcaceae bacterium]|jgi:hypothetical protein
MAAANSTARARGSSLLVVLIALAVLMVVVVGAIQFTGQNREASAVMARGERSAACAEAARRYLLSKLRITGVAVASLTLDSKLPDDKVALRQSRVTTGHYDIAAGVDAVGVASAGSVSFSREQTRNVANVIAQSTLGGTPYRVVVKCRDSSGREEEVELAFRYGL